MTRQDNSRPCAPSETALKYAPPRMEKHEPVQIVQGSGGGCSGLYYTSLYYRETTLYYVSLYQVTLYYFN